MTILGSIAAVLFGAAIGAFFTRRHWRLQQIIEAYTELLVEGRKEMNEAPKVLAVERYMEALRMDDAQVRPILHEEALNKVLHGMTCRFRHLLEKCWLLEKDAELQAKLCQLEDMFGSYYSPAVMQAWRKNIERFNGAGKPLGLDEAVRRAPLPPVSDEWILKKKKHLNDMVVDLRDAVARHYFHQGHAGFLFPTFTRWVCASYAALGWRLFSGRRGGEFEIEKEGQGEKENTKPVDPAGGQSES